MPKTKSGDGKFFSSAKKGQIKEWKVALNTAKPRERLDTVKKVIAAMTRQKDVSELFMDMVQHMATQDLALKKLIYLYIMNNIAKNPQAAILVVNSFQKDAANKSDPIIRALAIRTMGCIRVDSISEELHAPLIKALDDPSPYVKKTAAICVAKLYEINPDLVDDQEMINKLRTMLRDSNGMVVSNAVAALMQIAHRRGEDVLQINSTRLSQLMAAIAECNEWGIVFILDALAQYDPDPQEAQDVIERITPHLSHSNAAVVMSCVRVVVGYMRKLSDPAAVQQLVRTKLPGPLVSLVMNHKPEIQYVALRNINLLLQKHPGLLQNQVRSFFCKYNDKLYVKLEKLEIMIKLANAKNIDKVLMEFKTYCTEVDVEFVRKSVLAIGRCAIKLDSAAKPCILALIHLISKGSKEVIQETVVVIRDIFRKYPNQYEKIIVPLCGHLDTLNEPEARGAMIWIIGEYSGRVDNASELLESFLDTFDDENDDVKLQMLTAVVKLFMQKPDDPLAGTMMTTLLNKLTRESDNPDLRDRAFLYWRLLHYSPEAAEAVVLADKPVITDDDFNLSGPALDSLISQISTLASIYHKPPEFFVKDGKKTIVFKKKQGGGDDDDSDSYDSDDSDDDSDSESEDDASGSDEDDAAAPDDAVEAPSSNNPNNPMPDLFGDVAAAPAPSPATTLQATNPMNAFVPTGPYSAHRPAGRLILPKTVAAAKGVQIAVAYARARGQPTLRWLFLNGSSENLTNFQVQMADNVVGLFPTNPVATVNVPANGRGSADMVLNLKAPKNLYDGALKLKINTNIFQGVVATDPSIPAHIFFEEKGQMDEQVFMGALPKLLPANTISMFIESNENKYPDAALKTRLQSKNVFFVTSKPNNDGSVSLFAAIRLKMPVCVEVRQFPDKRLYVNVKSSNAAISGICLKGVHELITS